MAAIPICKRSQVLGLGFQVEGESNNSDPIRTRHKPFLGICVPSVACSVVCSDECELADGISIFRQGWKEARNNPKPLNP